MPTKALCTFGVRGRVTEAETSILEIADEFRRRYCAIQHAKHRAIIEWRNETFPALYAAMVESESLHSRIHTTEKEIKALHSEVRDRNAVTAEQGAALDELRKQRKAATATISRYRADMRAGFKAFSEWWKSLADWKNVKSRAKRRELYASIEPPKEKMLASYAKIWMEHDLLERDLSEEFADRLHSAIRSEIIDASKPKLGKDAPGMRYEYHREPEPKPWQKLSLQFAGGATLDELLSGRNRSLRVAQSDRPEYRGGIFYDVRQQIGTAANPAIVEYAVKFHRPFPPDAVIQRWSLVVRAGGKREVIPIIKTGETKPVGSGTFAYRLAWTVRKSGIEVARFFGDHVNERLIIPRHIVDLRRMAKLAQVECDNRANAFLASVGAATNRKRNQGVDALRKYCAANPLDNAAANAMEPLERELARAYKTSARAARCIAKIYETVAIRVCRLHAAVHRHEIDLAKIKRYDSRDLLREDVLPPESREILFAVAPGKLKALIDGYGLASAEVPPPEPGDARGTDIFGSYVASVRGSVGTRRAGIKHRSRKESYAATG